MVHHDIWRTRRHIITEKEQGFCDVEMCDITWRCTNCEAKKDRRHYESTWKPIHMHINRTGECDGSMARNTSGNPTGPTGYDRLRTQLTDPWNRRPLPGRLKQAVVGPPIRALTHSTLWKNSLAKADTVPWPKSSRQSAGWSAEEKSTSVDLSFTQRRFVIASENETIRSPNTVDDQRAKKFQFVYSDQT